jgi:hypothetical protein
MNFLTDSVMESMMYVELAYKETKKMAHDWVWKFSQKKTAWSRNSRALLGIVPQNKEHRTNDNEMIL